METRLAIEIGKITMEKCQAEAKIETLEMMLTEVFNCASEDVIGKVEDIKKRCNYE